MSVVLKDRTEIKVRFGEVDSMGIVWHGNYVKYIEESVGVPVEIVSNGPAREEVIYRSIK